jgi:hypothetical protein
MPLRTAGPAEASHASDLDSSAAYRYCNHPCDGDAIDSDLRILPGLHDDQPGCVASLLARNHNVSGHVFLLMDLE